MPFLIPDPIRKHRLHDIQKYLSDHKEGGGRLPLERAVMLMLQDPDFGRSVGRSPKLHKPLTDEASLMAMAWGFVYQQLYAGDLVAAAMVLFDEETFTPEPECTRLVWDTLMTKRMIIIIGGGGLGKTFSTCVYFLLQWLTDPSWTRVQVASASKDHLEKNAMGDMFKLYAGASMVLPGKADTVSISLEKKVANGVFSLILPGGPESKGKLKGAHTKARPAHPIFGRRSRVFCLVDEAQETPQNIFEEIPNRFSTVDGDDVDHIKFVLTANPKAIFSKFGACCKPKIGGWDGLERGRKIWLSESGYTVVSLDAMEHENIKQKRQVFPGFASWQGVIERLNNRCQGNWEHPEMYTYVYGKFPPLGLSSTVIKQQWLTAAEKEWVFDDRTVAKAGADPAFTGDRPAVASARVGRAIAWIDYAGDRHVLDVPMMAIQLDAVTVVQKTPDSQILADEYMEVLKPTGVKPEGVGVDKTGGGRGVFDIMRHQWAVKVGRFDGDEPTAPICGIEYGSSPSEIKVATEDSATPKEMYDIMASALWFEAAKLFEFGIIGIGKGVDLKVFAELAARQGGMAPGLGKKLTIESKAEFKRRTGMESPDLADASLVCIHVARVTTPNLIPRAKDTPAAKPEREVPAWAGFNQSFGAAKMVGMAGPGEMQDLLKD